MEDPDKHCNLVTLSITSCLEPWLSFVEELTGLNNLPSIWYLSIEKNFIVLVHQQMCLNELCGMEMIELDLWLIATGIYVLAAGNVRIMLL